MHLFVKRDAKSVGPATDLRWGSRALARSSFADLLGGFGPRVGPRMSRRSASVVRLTGQGTTGATHGLGASVLWIRGSLGKPSSFGSRALLLLSWPPLFDVEPPSGCSGFWSRRFSSDSGSRVRLGSEGVSPQSRWFVSAWPSGRVGPNREGWVRGLDSSRFSNASSKRMASRFGS
jgi:hypothetical protein